MEIIKKITDILSELSEIEEISLDNELQSDLSLNSLQLVTLLIVIEDDFEIILDESDMNPYDLITVNDVVNLVEKYVGGDNCENEEKS